MIKFKYTNCSFAINLLAGVWPIMQQFFIVNKPSTYPENHNHKGAL